MSDFPAAPVLEALELLKKNYAESIRTSRRLAYHKENVKVAQEDLNQENELLDELRSSFLPSIKHELKALSNALDPPHNSSEFPRPNVELSLDTLSNLNQIMQKAIQCISSAPLQPLDPKHAHDHSFKHCKAFRRFDLRNRVSRVESNLISVFWSYSRLIESWKLSSNLSEDPEYRTPTPGEETVECIDLIDQTIRLSQASDFALLQLKWQSVVQAFHEELEILANITGPHQKNKSIFRRRVVEQARLTVPVIKLLRILFDKILNTTIRQLPFTLDTELNSDTLHQLNIDPDKILFSCLVHVTYLNESHMSHSTNDHSGWLRGRTDGLSRTVDSYVVLLALYIIPLSSKIDRCSLQTDFKAWLSEWQRLWQTAKDHLLGAMCVPEEN